MRVSSKEQEKEGYSIAAQLNLLRQYSHDKGLSVVREFAEAETAKRAGREQFKAMIDYLKRNSSCRIVLVEKTDRLYRNFRDHVTIDDLDIELHFVKEGKVLSKASPSSDKFINSIKVVMAKNYIDNLSEETKKGMLQKAQEGMWPSFAPIGYRNVTGSDGRKAIEPDPRYAEIVARLFQDYATGQLTLKEITRKAKAEGLIFRKSQSGVSSSTVNAILKNRVYSGEFKWGGKVYQGKYEPLISRDLFEKVQGVLFGRHNAKIHACKPMFSYQGLIRCGHCGCAMVGETKKHKYTYYHCTGWKGKCPDPWTKEERLNPQFEDTLKCIHMDKEVLEWMITVLKSDHESEKAYKTQTLERLNAEYKRVSERLEILYSDKLDGRIDAAFYDRKAAEFKLEQERLLRSMQDNQASNDACVDEGIRYLELAYNAHADFQSKDDRERRDLLKKVLDGAAVKGGVLEPHYKPVFEILAVSNIKTPNEKPLEVGSKAFIDKWLPVVRAYRTALLHSLNHPTQYKTAY